MSSVREKFFESLSGRAHTVLSPYAKGTVRADLDCDGTIEHWYITIKAGSIEVTQEDRPADAEFHTSAELFDRIVTGKEQGIAAVFRNEMTYAGDVRLFLLIRRFFPSPPGTRDPRDVARAAVARRPGQPDQQAQPRHGERGQQP